MCLQAGRHLRGTEKMSREAGPSRRRRETFISMSDSDMKMNGQHFSHLDGTSVVGFLQPAHDIWRSTSSSALPTKAVLEGISCPTFDWVWKFTRSKAGSLGIWIHLASKLCASWPALGWSPGARALVSRFHQLSLH